jgi:hypothetical protein
MMARHGWLYHIDGPVVAVVAFDDQAEDIFVQAYCFAVVSGGGIDLGEQLFYLQRFGVERALDATYVVETSSQILIAVVCFPIRE